MTDLERCARDVFARVIADCDPAQAFDKVVRPHRGAWFVDGQRVDMTDVDDVRVIALGKPALPLAGACGRAIASTDIPTKAITGVAAVPYTTLNPAVHGLPSWLEVEVGGHPLPTAGSFRAGRRLLDLCSAPATSRTLVIACVGGGGSAIAESPILEGASVEAVAELTRHLLRADLTIREVNALRKRISAIKGGRLAIAASPARILTFIVSDVATGDVGSVASGPTIEDDSTRAEALDAIAKLEQAASLSPECRLLVEARNMVETPTWSDVDRSRARHVVLLDSSDASASAARHLSKTADIVDNLGVVDGPVDAVVQTHIDRLWSLTSANRGALCAVASAGEVTVDVRGSGSGGRNHHFALMALIQAGENLSELADFAIMSAGTDGIDGNTSAAGACVISGLLDEARSRGLDAAASLEAYDSAAFLAPLGSQIVTGPTGTNVCDLRLLIGVRR